MKNIYLITFRTNNTATKNPIRIIKVNKEMKNTWCISVSLLEIHHRVDIIKKEI